MEHPDKEQSQTYEGCLCELHFFVLFVALDYFLLNTMAHDLFVAICQPWDYTVIMIPQICGVLLLVCWLLSILDSLLNGLLVLQLSFCSDMVIPHFFRESNQVLQHTCSEQFLKSPSAVFCILVSFISFTSILFSYSKILVSILRISSVRGKYKVFSSCGSHISIVSLFYGTRL